MARIEALLRRGQAQAAVTTLEVAGLHMDLVGRTVARDVRPLAGNLAFSPDDSGVEEGWIRLAIQISHRKPGLYTVETAVTLFGPYSQTAHRRGRGQRTGVQLADRRRPRLAYPSDATAIATRKERAPTAFSRGRTVALLQDFAREAATITDQNLRRKLGNPEDNWLSY